MGQLMDWAVDTVKCSWCGSTIDAASRFCPMCGRDPEGEGAEVRALPTGVLDSPSMAFVTPMDPGPFKTPMKPVDLTGEAAPEVEESRPRANGEVPGPQRVERLEPRVAPHGEKRWVPVEARPAYSRQGESGVRREAQAAVARSVDRVQRSRQAGSRAAPPNTQYRQMAEMRQPVEAQRPTEYQYSYGGPQPASAAKRVRAEVAQQRELWGYLGFLGVGHIYAGHVARGLILMVAWWVFLPWVLTQVVIGRGSCFLPIVALLIQRSFRGGGSGLSSDRPM